MDAFSIPLPEGDSQINMIQRYEFVGGRTYSICVIKTPHKVVAGAAVCHPNDKENAKTGFKLAFSRALEQLYPSIKAPDFEEVHDEDDEVEYHMNMKKHIENYETRGIAWKFFLQEIQKAVIP